MFYALLQVTNAPRWGHSFFNVIWWQKWPTAIFFGKCKLNGSKKKHFAEKMAAQRQNGGGCVINGEKMLLFLANRDPAACCGNRPGSAIEIGGISSEKLTLFRHPTVRSNFYEKFRYCSPHLGSALANDSMAEIRTDLGSSRRTMLFPRIPFDLWDLTKCQSNMHALVEPN